MACLKGFEPLTNGLEGRCSNPLSYRHKSGGDRGFRTPDPSRMKAMLYQLSYITGRRKLLLNMAPTAGLEPATQGLTVLCSTN
jgi:hypothetical protein